MPPKIIRATSMGYCMGVQRAIDYAEKALNEKKNVYSHGPLIHNAQELERLHRKGLRIMQENSPLEENATLIIRAHGIHPQERAKLQNKNITLIDATCPLVLLNQKTVQCQSQQGAVVIIAGHAGHPEIQALVGYAKTFLLVEHPEEARIVPLKPEKHYFLIAQTTLRPAVFEEIEAILRQRRPDIEVLASICSATKERQEAVKALATQVDSMIVVGDKKSANSQGLVELAVSLGCPCTLIEDPAEVTDAIRSCDTIGLSAAASAPSWLIDAVEQALLR